MLLAHFLVRQHSPIVFFAASCLVPCASTSSLCLLSHYIALAHSHSLSLVLVLMIKSKELKAKISLTHSLVLSLPCPCLLSRQLSVSRTLSWLLPHKSAAVAHGERSEQQHQIAAGVTAGGGSTAGCARGAPIQAEDER